VDARFQHLEQRMDGGFERLDREIRDIRDVIFRFGGRIMTALAP
jgi:hypothetical protein